jgi:hypothetical protein
MRLCYAFAALLLENRKVTLLLLGGGFVAWKVERKRNEGREGKKRAKIRW